MKVVNRTSKVPAYIFSRLEKIKERLGQKGIEILDLGIGDPDIPTPEFILKSMGEAILDPRNHRYPPYIGIDRFRKSVADYYYRKFGVKLDYKKEIAALIGSKEGIAHIFLALADVGDYVLIPDPAYPVYLAGAVIAGCSIYKMKLLEDNGYLPQLDDIDSEVARRAKLLIVNYPNNPTGAAATLDFFKRLIEFGRRNDIVIANDGAYLDISCSGFNTVSLMQVDGASDIAVEFGSLSKSFNMTGWRLGYIVGNREVIEKLMVVKTNFDSGQFSAIQQAGADALNRGDEFVNYINKIYQERRNLVTDLLKNKGLHVYDSKGTFYVWFKVPDGYSSDDFASYLLEKTGVLITPGSAFGSQGEGYCRISLTSSEETLKKAMNKICSIDF
ncbi:LL-diaminopimelate aminotransferase [Fonticella tunisiensis]|uniref:Aminotransferase n=1 Tax=Fonticella tunisiensis TaxID=1096341 RepID=A0A4V6Q2Z5_9CLOT|nr:LL-diaminopimelate aminotransferase [Fonticella tunisiensis]